MGQTKPSARPFRCRECGARYTIKGAEKAQRDGCRTGCSGIDIEACGAPAPQPPRRAVDPDPDIRSAAVASATTAHEAFLAARARCDSAREALAATPARHDPGSDEYGAVLEACKKAREDLDQAAFVAALYLGDMLDMVAAVRS